MNTAEFLATLFGGMIIGGVVGISVVLIGLGQVASNVRVENFEFQVNETTIVKTMIEELDKKGYFETMPSLNYSNWTGIWYNYTGQATAPDCCYPVECTGIYGSMKKNCTCTYPVHCFTIYKNITDEGEER